MPSMLSPIAAPAPAPSPAANATTRRDDQDQTNPNSFGEALARSLEPAKEKSDKPVTKAVTPQLPRRATEPKKTDASDLANAMALSLVPLESRLQQTAVPAGAGAMADGAVLDARPASGNALIANAPALAISAAETDTQTELASGSAASNKKGAALSLKPGQGSANDDAALQTKLLSTATPAGAASAGLPAQSAKDDVKATHRLTLSNGDQADAKPVAALGSAKVAASASTTPLESASLTDADSALAASVATNASTALSMSITAATGQAPGGVTGANASAPVTTAALAPEVGGAEWGKALGQHVVQMSNAGHQVAELQLNPPGLGPLKVTLNMNDNQMQAMFVSTHAAVRAAVEQALPQLRATLAESGISLGNTSVGAESQQQTAFANNQGSQPNRSPYGPGAGQDADSAERLASRPQGTPTRQSSGFGIDTYA